MSWLWHSLAALKCVVLILPLGETYWSKSKHYHIKSHTASATFVGTSNPLQWGDVVVVLPDREGEDADLRGK